MNRMLVCLQTLVLLLVALPLAAQENIYTVKAGDNLWELAGEKLSNPLLWEKIYRDNPFLREPGRRFTKNGVLYVMVRPGEQLVGLERLGITAQPIPIEQLRLAQPAPVVIRENLPTWAWWPLGLALAMLISSWLIYRMLSRDPVNSRPAMVEGGVTEETAGAAIQQVAARATGSNLRESRTLPVYQQFQVLQQVAGRIWGNMTVSYADGRSIPRRLSGERAYRANVRFPDGHEEELYMLQGCGNDLRMGGINRYLPGPEFRFEADPELVAVPAQPVPEPVAQTAPAPEQTPPTPQPDTTPQPVVQPTHMPTATEPPTPSPQGEEKGVISFEFKKATNGQPAMVRLKGIEAEEFTFSVGSEGTTLRYREVTAE